MDRLPSRNLETLAVCTGMKFGKPRLKLGRNVKGNRKDCYKYISRIKNAKENLSPHAQWGRGFTDKEHRKP